jgi:hypothetical protein
MIKGIFKYFLLLVSPGDYVIKGAFVFNAGFYSHDRVIANLGSGVDNSIFKSDPIRSPYAPYASREILRQAGISHEEWERV